MKFGCNINMRDSEREIYRDIEINSERERKRENVKKERKKERAEGRKDVWNYGATIQIDRRIEGQTNHH